MPEGAGKRTAAQRRRLRLAPGEAESVESGAHRRAARAGEERPGRNLRRLLHRTRGRAAAGRVADVERGPRPERVQGRARQRRARRRAAARRRQSPVPAASRRGRDHPRVMVSFDDSSMPGHRATVVSYPTADGRQLEAFTRAPYKADSPQTYFHAAYYLHQTIAQDHAATIALVHRGTAAPSSTKTGWNSASSAPSSASGPR